MKYCFDQKLEDLLIDIFLKINFLSTLAQIYDDVYDNGVPIYSKQGDEEKILFLKKIVKILREEEKIQTMPKFCSIINKINSWDYLKNAFMYNL